MNKVLSFLGLLNKGGYLLIGSILEDKLSKAKLLIVAVDANSSNTSRLLSKAKTQGIEIINFASKEELGKAIGYQEISIIGIVDKKAATSLKNKIGKEKEYVQKEQ